MKLAYLAASLQTLVAAGTFVVAKDAHDHFTALQLVWFRITLSGILVPALFTLARPKRTRPPRADLARMALLALTGVVLNQGFFLFGLRHSTPFHASLIYAFTPVLVLAGSAIWLKRPIYGITVSGVAIAVTGVTLVLTARGLTLTEGPFFGDLLILVATTCWASYTLLGKPLLERHDPFTVIRWVFTFAAVFALPAAPWVWRGFDVASPGRAGWTDVLYLAVMTSGVAFTLWYYALRKLEPTQVAVFTNLQAPLTAFLVWILYGTLPNLQVVLGGGLVLAGIMLVQIPRERFGGGTRRRAARPGAQ